MASFPPSSLFRNQARHPIPDPIKLSSSQIMDPQNPPKRVIVCGGGIIGVCTAYFLSKKGAAVTVVEQSSIACAASGKAGGFLALDWCDGGPVSPLARASFNLHRSLAEELNGAESYGYRHLTTLGLSIAEATSSRSKRPAPIVPPWVDGAAKSPKIIGTTETTAQVHPQLFTKTLLAKAVEDYGVEVVIGRVESVEAAGGAAKAVALVDGRRIEGDAVVLALGPWSGKFGLLKSFFNVTGLKAHSIVLEPRDPCAISAHALFLTYYSAQGGRPMDPEVYPRPTGEVYICGMSAEAEVPDEVEQIAAVPESIAVLKTVAGSVSSQLSEGEATVKAEQACILPCTDDTVPVIGEVPTLKGCYVATGHSCWGILNGPATGAAVAELVLDGRAAIVDLAPFSPVRFLST
ncbi:putative oxidoreductase TDA3 [Salvia hispanica]|uniref:putative oxidoreductase TDA3 n=1 Tax=Salvia hispanica TaxID=49212 RepID=UPI002009A41A|nr:putative oxidoreductase TDA3 [Salvia hispanica]